jgi:hypothetical protein
MSMKDPSTVVKEGPHQPLRVEAGCTVSDVAFRPVQYGITNLLRHFGGYREFGATGRH